MKLAVLLLPDEAGCSHSYLARLAIHLLPGEAVCSPPSWGGWLFPSYLVKLDVPLSYLARLAVPLKFSGYLPAAAPRCLHLPHEEGGAGVGEQQLHLVVLPQLLGSVIFL